MEKTAASAPSLSRAWKSTALAPQLSAPRREVQPVLAAWPDHEDPQPQRCRVRLPRCHSRVPGTRGSGVVLRETPLAFAIPAASGARLSGFGRRRKSRPSRAVKPIPAPAANL